MHLFIQSTSETAVLRVGFVPGNTMVPSSKLGVKETAAAVDTHQSPNFQFIH
jgi:hypothetical protein